jgi:hypothetical protein
MKAAENSTAILHLPHFFISLFLLFFFSTGGLFSEEFDMSQCDALKQ